MSSDQKRHAHKRGQNGDEFVSQCDCDECSNRFDLWCEEKKREGKVVCEVKSKTICHYECISRQTEYKEWGWKREFKHHERRIEDVPAPDDCKDCDKGNKHGRVYQSADKKTLSHGEAHNHEGHDAYNDEEYIQKCDCKECSDRHDMWCKKKEGDEKIICKKSCKTIRYYHCQQKIETIKRYGWKREFKTDRRAYDAKEAPDCEDCENKRR
jgi:hypothetical protein